MLFLHVKRYKLRERDRHINIHVIVEEHYERYLDQEEEYMKDIAKQTLKIVDRMAPALTVA